MPKRTKPRRGSTQYWPRRRAKRIYSRVSHWPKSKEAKPLGFAGWKAGMTHIRYTDNDSNSPTYGKTIIKPVTILDAPSLFVCGLKFYKKTPYGLISTGEKWTDKIPKDLDLKKKTNFGSSKEIKDYDDVFLIIATQPKKSGMRKKKPDLFELAIGGEKEKKIEYANSVLGKELSSNDVFKVGEFIDASAVTKGYGFTGPVKRFGIRIQTRKDQQMHRHAGSIGGVTPRHVDWRVPLAGQYGFFNRTEFNKRIMAIEDDPKKVNPKGGFVGYGLIKNSFIILEGSVPGTNKRLIRLRKAVRTKKFQPIEIKSISLESKQG